MRHSNLSLLILLILLSSFPTFAQDFWYEGIWYTVLDEETKTVKTTDGHFDSEISDYVAGNPCSGDVIIPSTVSDGTNDYTVVEIGFMGFSNCTSLTSINLPDGVTSIEGYAFSRCSNLTSINIPDGVTSIGENTFSECSSLTSINIPDGVTSIEDYAFAHCSGLTSINLPDGVTSIGGLVFWGCSNLTSINIPDGVTSIGEYAFANCSGLTTINIPEGVTSNEHEALKI
ncbi:MAG: leucine-rich repeat domain-containing protein, partial [Muribaculaceae bacterium]|nr:leucine-rich repeat domain-containing protein [Muribaculaceae bacterium]